MNAKSMVAAWLAAGWVCATGLAADSSAPATCIPGLQDSPDAPVAVKAELTAYSAATGVICRVHITNTSAAPYSLRVCPNTYLCVVANLHPIVSYGDTGMGLLDLCAGAKPSEPHEVFLLPNATLSVDVCIPPDRVPKEAGKSFQVGFCYGFEAGKVVHSNALKIDAK